MELIVLRNDLFEILKLLKNKDMQSSKLAEAVKSVSISEAYKRIKLLEKEGFIEYYFGENERGQPIKIYRLTDLGRRILQRLEDAERIYKDYKLRAVT